jgi:hypothetical protein
VGIEKWIDEGIWVSVELSGGLVGVKKSVEFAIQVILLLKTVANFVARHGLICFVSGDGESIDPESLRQLDQSESMPHSEVAQPVAKGFWRDEVVIYVTADIGENFFESSLQYGKDAPQDPGLDDLRFVALQFGDGIMAQFCNCGIGGYAFITEPLSEVSETCSQCGFGGVKNRLIYR